MSKTPTMKVQCLYDELVATGKLKPHPKNRNQHPKDQIDRLAKILKYQGWRYPIKVSKRSGFITSGHGRLEAARMNDWERVPVNFQDYDSDEQEYADVQADNAISSWALLDFAGINQDLGDLGPDFDLNLLGIRDFTLDLADKVHEVNQSDESAEWVDLPEFEPGEGYIRLIFQFSSEENRLNYCKENHISIDRKMNNQWIVNQK